MPSGTNSENSSSGTTHKNKRRSQKEPTSSDDWPLAFQANSKSHSENESESSTNETDKKTRIMTKKTFNYLQKVHKLIPCTHVHSLLKVQ